MRFALVLSLLIAVLAIVFAVNNPQEVTVNLLLWEVRSTLAVTLVVVLLAGLLIGILASYPSIYRRSARIRKLEKQLASGTSQPVAAPPVVTTATPHPAQAPELSADASETERLAAQTSAMAEEAQRRANEGS